MNLHRNCLRSLAAATLVALAGPACAEPADGVLDPTFGTDGITMVAFDTAPSNPLDVALDAVVDSFGRTYLVGVAMTTDGQPAGTANRRALAIAGNDADANRTVTQLIDRFGFDVVDMGPLGESWRIQRDTPGYGPRRTADELRRDLAAAERPPRG